ncbi:MAG: glycosyltransferase family 2 protein [Pseudomonadota bacterium]
MAAKVYVLTPVYNGAEFLREAMDSVQAQTYPNLEHLVIENASTDATPQILSEYENARVPVRVIKNETLLRQVPNWNTAVEKLPEDAEWFRILCADDTMAPDFIEKTVNLGETDDSIGIVTCKVDMGFEIHHSDWPEDRSIFDGTEALKRFLTHSGNVLAPHVLYRRATIPDDQPFFDESVSAFDTDAVLRTYCDWKLGFLHDILAMNRVHEDSVTSKKVAPKRLHLFDWYHFLCRYGESGLGRQEKQRMLKRFRRHYLWRLVRASMQDGNMAVYREHKTRLQKLGESPTLGDAFDVLSDRVMVAVGLRPGWRSYPW